MSKIPKQIHYVWFGDKPLGALEKKCVSSWATVQPNYKITLWNESNFDINQHLFTKRAFVEKRWAFLSDFIRLKILYDHGGIYLDTDMEILKALDPFLDHGLFIGMESDTNVNASIIGAKKRHWLIAEILKEYDNLEEYVAIPLLVTKVLKRYLLIKNEITPYQDIFIYPTQYFYPLPFGKSFSKKIITDESYTIHWWNYSWGTWKSRLLKKLGLFQLAIYLTGFFNGDK